MIDRLFAEDFCGCVVGNDAVDQQAIMTVSGVGIEGYIADDTDLCTEFFGDGSRRAANQIIRLHRVLAIVRFFLRRGNGENGNGRNSE